MEKNKTSEDSIKILNRRSFIIIIVGAILSLIVSLRLFSFNWTMLFFLFIYFNIFFPPCNSLTTV